MSDTKRAWVSNAITGISALVMIVVFTIRLEGRTDLNAKDIANNNTRIKENKEAIAKVEDRNQKQYESILSILRSIDDKLDGKVDKAYP